MNVKEWFNGLIGMNKKGAMPILSFPCVQMLGVSVNELVKNSDLQAQGMKLLADRYNTLASVSMMDLSVEAEAFGSSVRFDENEIPTVIDATEQLLKDCSKYPNFVISSGCDIPHDSPFANIDAFFDVVEKFYN